MASIRIRGIVSTRVQEHGPPHESALFAANPRRSARIMAATGWPDVFPGSLNLKVRERYVDNLLLCPPALVEHAKDVIYPDKYSGIPAKRKGYLYYRCTITSPTKGKLDGLVRRAVVPLKTTVELFSHVSIRKTLGVEDGARLTIHVPTQAQPVAGAPRFFDCYERPVSLVNRFAGEACFLILSGPSFASLDHVPLRFCWTMAVNNAVKACMPTFRPNAWTCVDPPDKMLHTIWEDPTILKLAPSGFWLKPLWNSDTDAPVGRSVGDCPNVVYYARNERFDPSRFLSEHTVNWGNHSKIADANGVKGKRSCMLSAVKLLWWLGFRRIYLIGCDFRMTEGQRNYSFDQDRNKGSIHGNNTSYRQLIWRFEQLAPAFEAAGFHVYNCNAESGLTVFPFVAYEDALADALRWARPDWRQYVEGRLEKTAGMYESKWYRCPKCKADFRRNKEQLDKPDWACDCGFIVTRKDRKRHYHCSDDKRTTPEA